MRHVDDAMAIQACLHGCFRDGKAQVKISQRTALNLQRYRSFVMQVWFNIDGHLLQGWVALAGSPMAAQAKAQWNIERIVDRTDDRVRDRNYEDIRATWGTFLVERLEGDMLPSTRLTMMLYTYIASTVRYRELPILR